MGYANSRHSLAQDTYQRYERRGDRTALVLHLAVCHVADAVGSSEDDTVLHSLLPRQPVSPGCQVV
jgi:hypothetical protein